MLIEILLGITLLLILTLIVLTLKNSKKGDESEWLAQSFLKITDGQDRIGKGFKEEMSISRRENSEIQKHLREELGKTLRSFSEAQDKEFKDFSKTLMELTEKNEAKMTQIREAVEKKLELIQKDNTQQLEKMRNTVDEKLTETLDKRLTQKFKLVSDQLDKVHKGLGEMQDLAKDVDNLEKVLSNIKTRGTWGEVQLGRLLDQILTPHQYEKNFPTKRKSNDRVEFAIKIPSKSEGEEFIYLPIDVKFPTADYERLLEAQENADRDGVDEAVKSLTNRIKDQAKYIHDKYIDPPQTTDFGILYLPTEGLYAEITRQIGVCEELQRDYQIVVMGPNTVAAFLNSMQMGFRTLAIEERTSEVWELLSEIKKQFGMFGKVLAKTKKKLQEASNVIDKAETRTRVIQRNLDKVEQIPAGKQKSLPAPMEELDSIDAETEVMSDDISSEKLEEEAEQGSLPI